MRDGWTPRGTSTEFELNEKTNSALEVFVINKHATTPTVAIKESLTIHVLFRWLLRRSQTPLYIMVLAKNSSSENSEYIYV